MRSGMPDLIKHFSAHATFWGRFGFLSDSDPYGLQFPDGPLGVDVAKIEGEILIEQATFDCSLLGGCKLNFKELQVSKKVEFATAGEFIEALLGAPGDAQKGGMVAEFLLRGAQVARLDTLEVAIFALDIHRTWGLGRVAEGDLCAAVRYADKTLSLREFWGSAGGIGDGDHPQFPVEQSTPREGLATTLWGGEFGGSAAILFAHQRQGFVLQGQRLDAKPSPLGGV